MKQTDLFRTDKNRLYKAYEQRKAENIVKSADPVCIICSKCWYQAICLRNILNGQKPQTCCVYQLFSTYIKELTLKELVNICCRQKPS